MPINTDQTSKFISRILGTFLFAAVICLASDCQAQHQRARLFRGGFFQNGPRLFETRQHRDQFSNNSYSPLIRHPAATRNDDWRKTSDYFHSNERYPKYYGGFHSSHFNNIGIPAGDVGFRGNSIFWSPW